MAGSDAAAASPSSPASTMSVPSRAKPRIAVAGGYFHDGASADALAALDRVAAALGAERRIELPEPARARAAAFLITAAEGSNLHLADLKARAARFDPATRDRFLAGALIPASWVLQAQ